MTDKHVPEPTAVFHPSRDDEDSAAKSSLLRRPAAEKTASDQEPETQHCNPQSSFEINLGEIPGLEIVEEVARGGMGVVLRARDTTLNREVALKVLLDRQSKRVEVVRRFTEEAQIGGQLQHPGIVPVYGYGKFADGRPYFTMKLVKGRTLAKLFAERSDPTQNRTRLLKIFEQLCQAMAYAHSKNVIHRDLKPANVMLGNFGEVQVMDWGLAKVLDPKSKPKSGVDVAVSTQATVIRTVRSSPSGTVELEGSDTQSGSVLGTPGYMAPEQAIGDIEALDSRADVFGLGAILCELLTGRPPYVGTDATKTYQKALQADLSDAYTALDASKLDEELIALAKKCLSPKPENRPPNAGALAEELTHYFNSVESRLQVEQLGRIEAQATAIQEKKRRLAQLTYSGIACSVLLVGVIISSAFYLQARSARLSAEIAAANEILQRDRADILEASERQLRELNDKFKQEAEAFDAMDRLRRELAEKAQKNAESAKSDADAFSNFLVNQVLASARPTGIGDGLGVNVTLTEALTNAEGKIAEVFGDQPRAEATARHAMGITWRDQGKYSESEKQLRRAVEIRTNALGKNDDLTLQSLNGLAITLLRNRKTAEAISSLERVREAYLSKYLPDHPANIETLNNLALSYKSAGLVDKAIKCYEQIREIQDKSPPINEISSLSVRQNLAQAYAANKQLDISIPILEEVRNRSLEKFGPEDPFTLTVSNNLALMYRSAGQRDRAIKLLEQVCDGRAKVLNRDHPLTLNAMHSLATVYYEVGRKDDAFKLFEEVREARVRRFGVSNALTQVTLKDLESKYRASGKIKEANDVQRQILPTPMKE